MAVDAVDLSSAVVHASPADIASWPVTTRIERLIMRPGQNNGLSFVFSGNRSWPDYVPPGWAGPIQYTVWAGVQIANIWHIAGFIQMWRTRPSTGAPILTNWRDWAYDVNRWGPMVEFRPKAGDQMIFFLSAGNARKGSAGREADVTSVRERSNVALVALPAGDDGDFTFEAEAAATVNPATSSTASSSAAAGAATATATQSDLDLVLKAISELGNKVQSLTDAVKSLKGGVPV
jgi:hypothetical protein